MHHPGSIKVDNKVKLKAQLSLANEWNLELFSKGFYCWAGDSATPFSVLQSALLDQELLYWSIQAETSKKRINTR